MLRQRFLLSACACLSGLSITASATTYYQYYDLGAAIYPLGISSTAGYIVGGNGGPNGVQMIYMKVNTATGAITLPVTAVPTVNTTTGKQVIANVGYVNGVNDAGTLVGQDQMHLIGYQYTIGYGNTLAQLGPVLGAYPSANDIFPSAISNSVGNMCGWSDYPIPAGSNCWFNGTDYPFPPAPLGTFAGFGAVNDAGVCSAFYGSEIWNSSTNTWTQVSLSTPTVSSTGVGSLFLTTSLLGCPYCGMNASNVDMGTTANGSGVPIPFIGTSASQLSNPYNSGSTVYGSVGYGINNAGIVVGTLQPGTTVGPHAFVAWTSGAETDLNGGSVAGVPANTTLEYATAIDNTVVSGHTVGCIVGVSAVKTTVGHLVTTTYHGYVLIPTAVVP